MATREGATGRDVSQLGGFESIFFLRPTDYAQEHRLGCELQHVHSFLFLPTLSSPYLMMVVLSIVHTKNEVVVSSGDESVIVYGNDVGRAVSSCNI
jgi:hypothetical protein